MNKNKFYEIENKIDKLVFATEKNISKNYKDASAALKKEMAELFEKYGQLDFETMNKYNRLESLEKKLADTTRTVYGANRQEINGALRDTFVETTKELLTVVHDDTTIRLRGINKPQKVTEVINSKVKGLDWRDRMGKHQGDLLYDLKKEIGAGLSDGDTYGTVAKRLQEVFDIDENKAQTIARNETARVRSASQKETLDNVAKEGVKMTKTWHNVLDERSRGARATDQTNHMAMEGVTVPYEDDFVMTDGRKGPAPRLIDDRNGEHNIHCRCFISIEFKKEGADDKGTND